MSRVRIVEVGPRDGLQNEPQAFDVPSRIEFVQRLIAAGVQNVEVGAFVSPKWVPQMSDSAQVLQHLRDQQVSGKIPKNVRLLSLVPNQKGFEDAIDSGAKEIAIFAAASESFSKANTNAPIREVLERLAPVAAVAKKKKIKVRGYVSTCFYCPFEGKVKETQVLKVVEALSDMGCYEISIGDTVGAATPNEVRSLNKKLIRAVGKENLAGHFHDTRGTALANVLVSLEAGITSFDSSLGGLGGCPYAPGAAGNVATEDVVYMLHGMGVKTGLNLEKLQEVNEWVSGKTGRKLRGARLFRAQPRKSN